VGIVKEIQNTVHRQFEQNILVVNAITIKILCHKHINSPAVTVMQMFDCGYEILCYRSFTVTNTVDVQCIEMSCFWLRIIPVTKGSISAFVTLCLTQFEVNCVQIWEFKCI
jgi:hypothetical protein